MINHSDADDLLLSLAKSISRVLPSGFEAKSADGKLEIKRGPTAIRVDFTDIVMQGGDTELHIERAVDGALSAVQDFLVRELRAPWPPHIGNSGVSLAMPEVRIDWPRVRMWYGDASDPVLRLHDVLIAAQGPPTG
jgi:hypothetical protein